MNPPFLWRPGGRSRTWRTMMGVAGTVLVGAGVTLILWPHLLAYAVASGLLLVGGVLLLGAIAARGRGVG